MKKHYPKKHDSFIIYSAVCCYFPFTTVNSDHINQDPSRMKQFPLCPQHFHFWLSYFFNISF